MARTAKGFMNMIQDSDIKMIDIKIVDINGLYPHVTIPASQFSDVIHFESAKWKLFSKQRSKMAMKIKDTRFKTTVLYERLSKGDEAQGESNSIVN